MENRRKPSSVGTVKIKILLLFGLVLLLSVLLVPLTLLALFRCHSSAVGCSSVSTGCHTAQRRLVVWPRGFARCWAGGGVRRLLASGAAGLQRGAPSLTGAPMQVVVTKSYRGPWTNTGCWGVTPSRGFSCVVMWSSPWRAPFSSPQNLSEVQVVASHPVQPNTAGRRPQL